jgi:ABC-2 type transport system ATP-binding protein
LLNKFGIDKRKKVKELSKGMKVKLSIALAMAHNPEFLILDEPTSGLDPVVRNELLDLLREIIQDEKRSILFSSHITSDIEKIADFVTIIDNGRIIISEEKDTFMEKWTVVKADNSCFSSGLAGRLIGVRKSEFGFSGITDNLREFSSAFSRQFPQGKFKTEKANLDDILLRLVKEGEQHAEAGT